MSRMLEALTVQGFLVDGIGDDGARLRRMSASSTARSIEPTTALACFGDDLAGPGFARQRQVEDRKRAAEEGSASAAASMGTISMASPMQLGSSLEQLRIADDEEAHGWRVL